jgi:hypothetical protein
MVLKTPLLVTDFLHFSDLLLRTFEGIGNDMVISTTEESCMAVP